MTVDCPPQSLQLTVVWVALYSFVMSVLVSYSIDHAGKINFHHPTDRPTFLSIFLWLKHSIDVKQQFPCDISSLLPDSNFASKWGHTLGARDFSSTVSGFCQVFIAACGFGLRPKICRPSVNTENSRRAREKPLVPRVMRAPMEAKFLDDNKPKTLGCSSEILNETLKGDQCGRGPTFFWPLRAIILNFNYMNRVNKTNWKYIIFLIFPRVQP